MVNATSDSVKEIWVSLCPQYCVSIKKKDNMPEVQLLDVFRRSSSTASRDSNKSEGANKPEDDEFSSDLEPDSPSTINVVHRYSTK